MLQPFQRDRSPAYFHHKDLYLALGAFAILAVFGANAHVFTPSPAAIAEVAEPPPHQEPTVYVPTLNGSLNVFEGEEVREAILVLAPPPEESGIIELSPGGWTEKPLWRFAGIVESGTELFRYPLEGGEVEQEFMFRYRYVLPDGTSAYSNVVSLAVPGAVASSTISSNAE